jgi:phosphopantetheinyl transferase (holo-ACP synthase)
VISTGNDIIALNVINNQRTKQERFYSKIISFSELELYQHKAYAAMPFENFVWLLWSVKESVFKYQQRNIPALVFSPVKIVIQSIDFPESTDVIKFKKDEYERSSFAEKEFYNCTVNAGGNIFYSRSKIFDELINTVVEDNDQFENICWGIKFIDHTDYDSQSNELRAFVLKKFSTLFPANNLQIQKNAIGYPVLIKEKKEMDIPVSFSHHDHFIGYSFLLRNLS